MIPPQFPKCRQCWRRTANLGGVCGKCLQSEAKAELERLKQALEELRKAAANIEEMR